MPFAALRNLLRAALWLALSAGLGLSGAARAEDVQQPAAKVAGMTVTELGQFVDAITVAVGQDSLKMQAAAQAKDCLDLIRMSNSFTLAYGYLDAARSAPAMTAKDEPALSLRARIAQARVLTFAARMKVDDWLKGCTAFVVPDAQRSDPRYQPPVAVANGEFAGAVADAHEGAVANLAAAAVAAKLGACPAIVSAGESMSLYMPYLDKLSKDLATRPEVLGPRVSRRILDSDLAQMQATEQALWQKFGPTCTKPADGKATPPDGKPADGAASPSDTKPAP